MLFKNGFYCCSYLTNDSTNKLNLFLKSKNLQKLTDYYFHCTIMFSTVIPFKIKLNVSDILIKAYKFTLLGDSLVILVKSNLLNKRHQKWLSFGCEYTFNDYTPHITIIEKISEKFNLSSDHNKKVLQKLLDLNFNLDLNVGKEIISDLED